MSEGAQALARTLMGLGRGTPGGLVMGRVLGTVPLRVLAEGNAQDRDSLLKDSEMDLSELKTGDMLALWPIEERQRYVILAKVVGI